MLETIRNYLLLMSAAVFGIGLFYILHSYLKFLYDEYMNCPKTISSYRYKQTIHNMSEIKNSICELLSFDTVLLPIKISCIRINDNIHRLNIPILFNHHCELNDEYVRTHYPSIYKCRCSSTIDRCKIIKNTFFTTFYEYTNGCIELIDYDGDIREINSFCRELRNTKSRIYRMCQLDECQLFDNCPVMYIDPITNNSSKQKHKKCIYATYRSLKERISKNGKSGF